MLKAAEFSPKQNVLSFKNNDKSKNNQNNLSSVPYKTTSGIKTASGYAVVGVGIIYGLHKYLDNLSKKSKDIHFSEAMSKAADALKKVKTFNIARFLVTTLACGLIVDNIVNKKRAKLAVDLKTRDIDTLMKEDKNIEKTEKGNAYYKSSLSKNIGPALGLGVIALNSAMNLIIRAQKGRPIKVNGWNVLDGACTAVLGGTILGAITDKFSNKAAKAHADGIVK